MAKAKKIPASDLPVMAGHCATCPFKPDESGSGKWQDIRLANAVVERTLFKAHQICHGTEGPKREARFRCKGAFDHNMEIYRRLRLDHLVK